MAEQDESASTYARPPRVRDGTQDIRRAARAFCSRGSVAELRAINARVEPRSRFRCTLFGYYTDPKAFANHALRLSESHDPQTVCGTLNPVQDDLLARSANRFQRAQRGGGATDADVVRRRVLLVDLDPRRPQGVSATDAECEAALERARKVAEALASEGWPQPVYIDSGNGAHLWFRLDLPNDNDATRLVRGVTLALAERFTDEHVEVDRATWNASRLAKIPGTCARKGDHVAKRPHRLSRFIEVPDPFVVVPREALEELARPALEKEAGGAAPKQRRAPTAPPTNGTTTAREAGVSDDELLTRIRRSRAGGDFEKLWRGDTSGYDSSSEADLALCSLLAFWVGPDPERIGNLLRGSGLRREKHDREDYVQSTAEKALEDRREYFDWKQEQRRRRNTAASAEDGDNMGESPDGGDRNSASAADLIPYKPFPVGLLPSPLDELVRSGAQAIGCAHEFIALPALAMLAGSIGNSRRIEVRRGWCEPCVLWAATIADSGQKKSPALDLALAPAHAWQAEKLREHAEELEVYEREKRKHKHKAKKKKCAPPDEPEPEPPKAARLVVSDTTVEALAALLADAPRGLLLARDELSAWLRGFDAYRPTASDVGNYLQMHGARALAVDRKTGDKKFSYAPRAALSICGTIQPSVLARALIGRDPSAEPGGSLSGEHIEDGLASRFLFAQPPPTPGDRWRDEEVPAETTRRYAEVFERLVALPLVPAKDGDLAPLDVPLADDARAVFKGFVNEIGRRIDEAGTGAEAALFAKIEGAAARLALVLHLARWAADPGSGVDPELVDLDSTLRGVELARWFAKEGRRVLGALVEDAAEAGQRELLEWIGARGGEVTVRELTRGPRRYRDHERAQQALDGLAEDGVGEWVERRHGRGPPTWALRLIEDSGPENLSPRNPSPGGVGVCAHPPAEGSDGGDSEERGVSNGGCGSCETSPAPPPAAPEGPGGGARSTYPGGDGFPGDRFSASTEGGGDGFPSSAEGGGDRFSPAPSRELDAPPGGSPAAGAGCAPGPGELPLGRPRRQDAGLGNGVSPPAPAPGSPAGASPPAGHPESPGLAAADAGADRGPEPSDAPAPPTAQDAARPGPPAPAADELELDGDEEVVA